MFMACIVLHATFSRISVFTSLRFCFQKSVWKVHLLKKSRFLFNKVFQTPLLNIFRINLNSLLGISTSFHIPVRLWEAHCRFTASGKSLSQKCKNMIRFSDKYNRWFTSFMVATFGIVWLTLLYCTRDFRRSKLLCGAGAARGAFIYAMMYRWWRRQFVSVLFCSLVESSNSLLKIYTSKM